MMYTNAPQPAPKISCPSFVVGEVTGSVAIKNAPVDEATDSRCTAGLANRSGSSRWQTTGQRQHRRQHGDRHMPGEHQRPQQP